MTGETNPERARLRDARVLLVGMGGLGAPASLQLAAAGVGTLILVDFDRVDESNLQRQVIFDTADVGQPKVQAAAARLRAVNPGIRVECVDAAFDASTAPGLVASADLVVDGADNFATRYLVNDACVMGRRPNVFGSVARFEGQVSVFGAPGGPCYRCLHPEPPPDGLIPSCAEGGVLGVLPGLIGALQAVEAVKLLTGVGDPLVGRLLVYDALRMRLRDIVLPRDPACSVCGDDPTITGLAAIGPICTTSTSAGDEASIDVATFGRWRAAGRPHLLIDVREPSEHATSSVQGARLIPLGTLFETLASLPTDRPLVVHCRSGGRSARAVAQLRAKGYDARSLTGGIQAWLRDTN